MSYDNDRRYTDEHEWARKEGDLVVIGITKYAQESLGDVVYVELPTVGDTMTQGQSFGVVESTKAVSELYAPLTGEIVEVNSPLVDAPETLNADPHASGWIVKIRPANPADYDALLTAEAYEKLVANN